MQKQPIITAFIVLMLIASANAWPVLSFVDEHQTITTTPGSVVHLEIQTNETIVGLDARIEVYGDAVITGAINRSDCAAYGWDPGLSFDPLGLGTKTVEIGIGIFPGGNSGPIVAYVDITYGSGQVIVSGYEPMFPFPADPPYVFSPGVVTMVPEPATLLLLALGALTLRRKRRP